MFNLKNTFKYFIVILLVFIAILSAYWFKSHLGYSFSKNFSLSRYFPFSYLKRNYVIEDPEPGILLNDSFDSWRLFSNWTKPWMREKDSVSQHYELIGRNSSRCLVIKNRSDKSWSISHNQFVEVQNGDVYSYQVFVKLKGENPSSWVGVALLDKNQDVFSWNYGTHKTERTGMWITLKNTFIIPDGIAYIQFRLAGTGEGEFWFDDVSFIKEKGE